MGPKTETLIVALGEVSALLENLGDRHPADQVSKGKVLLEQSDFSGISHVLTVFNPKSSLNDVDWSPVENEFGHLSTGGDFQAVSATIYELADDVRREVEGEER